MAGQTTEAQAREVLDLTQGVELTKRPINDGYTSLAGNQHPDAGGDEARSHALPRRRNASSSRWQRNAAPQLNHPAPDQHWSITSAHEKSASRGRHPPKSRFWKAPHHPSSRPLA